MLKATTQDATSDLKPGLPVRLGVVSFLNDCSGEILSRTLPLFFTTGLGLSPLILGLVEGLSEVVNILTNAVAGWISDRMESRKPLVVLGYSLSALGRSLMFFTQVAPLIALARVFDRFGKGVRTAPRDALIADGCNGVNVGRAFGIARSMDTVGAVTGLLLAMYFGIGQSEMTLDLFRTMLFMSVPFAWLAALTALFWLPRLKRHAKARIALAWHIPREISPLIGAIAVFAIGASSDAFLVLRAREVGFTFSEILLLFVAFNILASVIGWLVGGWSDKFGRFKFLVLGWLVYAACYAVMGMAVSHWIFATAFATYGAFYGLTDGVEKAFLSDLLSPHKRGLGYGALQMTMACAAIPANLLTGYLATRFDLSSALFVSAVFSFAGAMLLISVKPLLRVWGDSKHT